MVYVLFYGIRYLETLTLIIKNKVINIILMVETDGFIFLASGQKFPDFYFEFH
jgi:hypothetical protein